MAWTWCKTFGRWTLLYSDSVNPAPSNIPSWTEKNNCVLGNTPLSGVTPASGFPLRWDILPNFYITMVTQSGTTRRLAVFGDGSQLFYLDILIDSSRTFYIGFTIDIANQKANITNGYVAGGTTRLYWIGATSLSSTQMSALYPYVKAAMEIIVPEWKALSSISGKSGHFELSKIAQAYINEGNAVNNGTNTNIERYVEQTNIFKLAQSIDLDTDVPVIKLSESDYMTIRKHYNTSPQSFTYTVKFFYAGSQIYGDFPFVATDYDTNEWYLSFIYDDTNEIALPSIIYKTNNPVVVKYNQVQATQINMKEFYRWIMMHTTPDNINDEDPGTDPSPIVPDIIDGITVPNIGAIETGFTSIYQIGKTELQDLSAFLWSSDFVENVSKFFNDPREIIVGLSIMPVAPSVGTSKTIKAGGISTGVAGNPLTSQYKVLEDFASIPIPKTKGNFLDYPPYTKIIAHLPFVGEHSLDVNDVMGKTLSLTYIFDFLSGSVVACIKVDGSAHYFFGGSCAMQIPTSSEDFGRMYSSVLSAGATLGASLATMATGGLTAPLAIGAGAAMANNGMNMSPDVQHTSGSGSINGMLGSQSAYITIEMPKEKLADNQNKFSGKMSLINSKIKNCSGYIKCFKVHTDGIKATLDERKEITSYMMNGFRRETGSSLPDLTPVTSGDTVILFMKCTSEEDVMGKTWDVTTLKLEGKMVYNQNILTPEFTIKGDISAYNYAYIPLFNRYYYIKSIVALSADAMGVKFQVDALQSFKTQIDECDVILERQETKSNSLMNDPEYWTLQSKDIIPKYFRYSNGEKCVFDRNDNVYILTIAGSDVRTP